MVSELYNGLRSSETSAFPSPTSSMYQVAINEPNAMDEAPFSEGRVLIIMTGGTICMQRSKDGYVPATGFLDTCLRPRPSFNDGSPPKQVPVAIDDGKIEMVNTLRTPPSKYARRIRFAALEFNPLLDSSSIDARGWSKIAKAIERINSLIPAHVAETDVKLCAGNYQLYDAFIILHGTDSLAYTSSALSFMISNLGKPIILTGSQSPMSELHSDATDNLLGSLIMAGHYMVPEVCLFFRNKLFRGNRATKINAHDFAAFSSPNFPPLAKVGVTTIVNWNLVQRPSRISPFTIQTNLKESHVACLRVFPGILPEMIRGVLKIPLVKGLVLETFGSGNAPEDEKLFEVLAEGINRGIVIVSVTQCQVGSVSHLYAAASALKKAGVVFGLDMTSEAALTKLTCLLANPALSSQEISRQMAISMRGELTEQAEPHFSHPSSRLSPMLSSLSSLGYAIQDQNIAEIDHILRESDQFLLNQFDYSGNTPLHLASACSNIEILRNFLNQGASVHLRNKDHRTPLYLAADAGRVENVVLLKESGAHLHADEVEIAKLLRDSANGVGKEAWDVACGFSKSCADQGTETMLHV